MNVFDSIILAIALAMDCFAISVATGVASKKIHWPLVLEMAFAFGFMQMFMPFLTVMLGQLFASFVAEYEHWLALGILFFLGGKMIYEDWFISEELDKDLPVTKSQIFLLSVATSIDALATGVLFVNMTVWGIVWRLLLIGLASFLFTVIGNCLGHTFGKVCGKVHVETIGGVILILIGVKIFIEHYV